MKLLTRHTKHSFFVEVHDYSFRVVSTIDAGVHVIMICQCFKVSVCMKHSIMAGKFGIFSGLKQAEDSANCGVILQETNKTLQMQTGILRFKDNTCKCNICYLSNFKHSSSNMWYYNG